MSSANKRKCIDVSEFRFGRNTSTTIHSVPFRSGRGAHFQEAAKGSSKSSMNILYNAGPILHPCLVPLVGHEHTRPHFAFPFQLKACNLQLNQGSGILLAQRTFQRTPWDRIKSS
eukprot:5965374-Amphidinium_carterae.1